MQAAKHMMKLMKHRIAKRPPVAANKEKWDHVLRKYDVELLPGEHTRLDVAFILGRTEMSMVMEGLFLCMPKYIFGGVLDMCVRMINAIRDERKLRDKPATPA